MHACMNHAYTLTCITMHGKQHTNAQMSPAQAPSIPNMALICARLYVRVCYYVNAHRLTLACLCM